MRRMILTSFVLLPVMAYAQARTSTVTQPSPSSAVNEAELTQPVQAAELAMKMPAKNTTSSMHALVRESVKIDASQDFTDSALIEAGTLEYAMSSTPAASSPLRVARAVEIPLSGDELAEQPAVTNVVVHAIVDGNGIPRNASVTQSGGRLIDRRAVAAVNQYRFVPATIGNRPTWSSVSIAIQIRKQE